MTYAKGTTVSVEKSQAELSKLLTRHGAKSCAVGRTDGFAIAYFELAARQVRLRVPLPTEALFIQAWTAEARAQRKAAWAAAGMKEPDRLPRSTAQQRTWIEAAERQRWRALILLTKAKLEAIELGLSTVGREFLADLMLPGWVTVHEEIATKILAVYETGNLPPLLGAGS